MAMRACDCGCDTATAYAASSPERTARERLDERPLQEARERQRGLGRQREVAEQGGARLELDARVAELAADAVGEHRNA